MAGPEGVGTNAEDFVAAHDALGGLATPRYLIIDLQNLDPDEVGALQDVLRGGWDAPGTAVPDRWNGVVGNILARGEVADEHGVLADREELTYFLDPDLNRASITEVSVLWNALAQEHKWAVKAAESRTSFIPRNDADFLQRESLLRLFTTPLGHDEALLDVHALRDLLRPLVTDGGVIPSGIRSVGAGRVRFLAEFVNYHLGVTGDDALPVTPPQRGASGVE